MASKFNGDNLVAEVRAGLARKGYTQNDLAAILSLSRGAVSRRLTGEVALDYREVKMISDFIGVPVAVLYGEAVAA